MSDYEGFIAINDELQKRRDQRDSVSGKDTPFRVEFRYGSSSKSWQYFTCYEDALKAEDTKCSYNIFGNAVIKRPSSRQVQVRGPRGEWSKYTPAKDTQP